jgi:hypothetical protein
MVLYLYSHNDFKLRSHNEFIAAAEKAEEKSSEKRIKSISGIKGLSCLLEIMSFPQQILLDYMHLVYLGHVQTLVRRSADWTNKENVIKIDNMLFTIRVPHNIHVVYKESVFTADNWKEQHNRLFVLNIGLPIGQLLISLLFF